MKLTYNSRNYLHKKYIKSNASMQSIITNDISNNTFNSNFSKQKSFSKCSNIYLSFENLPNNSLNTPKKNIYKISSKERKPIEKFLLTIHLSNSCCIFCRFLLISIVFKLSLSILQQSAKTTFLDNITYVNMPNKNFLIKYIIYVILKIH